MDVGLVFSFLSKFWEIVKVHLITLSRVLGVLPPFPQYTIFYGGRGAEVARSVRKFLGQKEGMLVCCSKPEMTFLEDQSQDKQKVI